MDVLASLANPAPFPYAGELAAALCALLWASAGIGFAGIRTPITGAALNFGKNLTAAAAFVVLFTVRTGSPVPLGIPGPTLAWLVASGVVGLAICDVFLMRSLLRIGPQRMSLVFCLVPVLTVIGAALPPFGEHPGLLIVLGMLIALGGIVLAILERTAGGPTPHDLRAGVRDAVIASLFQVVSILMVRHAVSLAEVEGAAAAHVRLTSGALALVLLGLVRGRLGSWWHQVTRPVTRLRLPLSALVGTFLGIWLNQLGLQWSTHAGVAATLLGLTPIYLLPLSAIFLGERRRPIAWVATAIAVAGVSLIAIG